MNFRQFLGVICVKNLRESVISSPLGGPINQFIRTYLDLLCDTWSWDLEIARAWMIYRTWPIIVWQWDTLWWGVAGTCSRCCWSTLGCRQMIKSFWLCCNRLWGPVQKVKILLRYSCAFIRIWPHYHIVIKYEKFIQSYLHDMSFWKWLKNATIINSLIIYRNILYWNIM